MNPPPQPTPEQIQLGAEACLQLAAGLGALADQAHKLGDHLQEQAQSWGRLASSLDGLTEDEGEDHA